MFSKQIMLLVESKQIGEKQIERNKWSLKNYEQPLLHKHFYILSGPLMFWGFFYDDFGQPHRQFLSSSVFWKPYIKGFKKSTREPFPISQWDTPELMWTYQEHMSKSLRPWVWTLSLGPCSWLSLAQWNWLTCWEWKIQQNSYSFARQLYFHPLVVLLLPTPIPSSFLLVS